MATGQLDVQPLIEQRFALDDAPRAYELLAGDAQQLGILLEYAPRPVGDTAGPRLSLAPGQCAKADQHGPGGWRSWGRATMPARVLIPAFARSGARLLGIASRGGLTAAHVGRKFGFAEVTTDAGSIAGGSARRSDRGCHPPRHARLVRGARRSRPASTCSSRNRSRSRARAGSTLRRRCATAPAEGRPLLMVGFQPTLRTPCVADEGVAAVNAGAQVPGADRQRRRPPGGSLDAGRRDRRRPHHR